MQPESVAAADVQFSPSSILLWANAPSPPPPHTHTLTLHKGDGGGSDSGAASATWGGGGGGDRKFTFETIRHTKHPGQCKKERVRDRTGWGMLTSSFSLKSSAWALRSAMTWGVSPFSTYTFRSRASSLTKQNKQSVRCAVATISFHRTDG